MQASLSGQGVCAPGCDLWRHCRNRESRWWPDWTLAHYITASEKVYGWCRCCVKQTPKRSAHTLLGGAWTLLALAMLTAERKDACCLQEGTKLRHTAMRKLDAFASDVHIYMACLQYQASWSRFPASCRDHLASRQVTSGCQTAHVQPVVVATAGVVQCV